MVATTLDALKASAAPLLQLRHVTIKLNDMVLLRDINLHVAEKETVALMGVSGCGKSTLLKAIMQLLPTAKSQTLLTTDTAALPQYHIAGSMRFYGQELTALSDHAWQEIRGKQIGMVIQNAPDNFDERKMIMQHFYEAVAAHKKKLFHHLSKYEKQEVADEAYRILYSLRMPYPERIRHMYSYEFSVGTLQRIALALCLILQPQLILADEFTSALDLYTRLEVLQQLKQLQEEMGFGLLFITHYPDEAAFMAERTYTIDQGTIS